MIWALSLAEMPFEADRPPADDDCPEDLVPLISAHTTLGTYKRFQEQSRMKAWFNTDLQKTVVCKVNAKTFEKAKYYGEFFALIEVHHKELGELGLGFNIYDGYPKFMKFLKLYKAEEKK